MVVTGQWVPRRWWPVRLGGSLAGLGGIVYGINARTPGWGLHGQALAVVRGYGIDPGQKIHVLRMVRTMLHGFATLEVASGFQIDVGVEDSFTWMIDFIDHGLQSLDGSPRSPADSQILHEELPGP